MNILELDRLHDFHVRLAVYNGVETESFDTTEPIGQLINFKLGLCDLSWSVYARNQQTGHLVHLYDYQTYAEAADARTLWERRR